MRNLFIYILLFVSLNVNASVLIDGIYYNLSTSTATVTHGTNLYYGRIDIPAEIEYNSKTYSVTEIGEYAFQNCTSLREVNLPNTITYIRHYSFSNTGISKIILPESVTDILEGAFNACSSLKTIEINSKINIGKLAFNNTSLEKVCIPSLDVWCGIKFYGDGIDDCKSNPIKGADLYVNGEIVEDLIFPDTIATIQARSFSQCRSIKRVFVPSNITHMGVETFAGCSSIEYAENMSSLPFSDYAFQGCKSLTYVKFGVNSGLCKNTTFSGCGSLTKVELPLKWCEYDVQYSSNQEDYLRKIFPYVREYVLPEGVTHIGALKFYNCDSLAVINIPSTVVSTGKDAFSYCKKLNIVNIVDLSAYCNIEFGRKTENDFGASPLNNGSDLYVSGEKLVNCTIPEGITTLNNFAFYGCKSIESVILPNSLSMVNSGTFTYCENLSYVQFPDKDVIFTSDNFAQCPKLKTAGPLGGNCNIEYGWKTEIPSSAFRSCYYLSKIFIPSTITKIGDFAFSGCNIDAVYCDAIVPPTISSHTFSEYGTLFVPGGSSQSYSSNNYWSKFNIVELVYIESLRFPQKYVNLIVGDTCKLIVDIVPSNATYQNIHWQSLDKSIVTVDETGRALALKTGKTRISATTTDGTELTAYCDVYVTNPVSDVTLNNSELSLEVGQSYTLTAACLPEDADDTTIRWTSEDETIANVEDGKVTALKLGKTTIKACSVNGIEAACEVNVVPTLVTNVLLDNKEISLHAGDNYQLSVNMTPINATYKDVLWNSNDSTIVKVDDYGVVTALGNGTTDVYVKTTDGTNLADSCRVTVTTLARSIELNKQDCDMIVGEGLQLIATILPSTTSDKKVLWKSSDDSIAEVDAEGYVKALSTGRVSVSATSCDGTNLYASCIINVTNPVMSVSLNKAKVDLMVGKSIQLIATCTPSNADDTTITWYSENPMIATVENGVVTGRALGNTIITANSVNGKEARCTITVIPTPVTSVSLDRKELNLNAGDTYKLLAQILPADATNMVLAWESSNNSVATVSPEGLINALATGQAVIKASTTDGSGKDAICVVNVKTPVLSLSVSPKELELLIDEKEQLTAQCTPVNADNTKVTWKSDAEQIATVSANGVVTAKSYGEAVITATTTDGTSLYCEIPVKVKKHPQIITWNSNLSNIICDGELIEIHAEASSGLPVVYSSSNEDVLSVFDMGSIVYLNPIGVGTAKITVAQSGNDYYESVSLTKDANVVDPAGINDITTKENLTIYNLQGNRIGTFTRAEFEEMIATKRIPQGVYVVNGKKINIYR